MGGHREEHETGCQCAVREVYEEAGLCIKPLSPQTTYLAVATAEEKELQVIQWQTKAVEEPDPFLVVSDSRAGNNSLSLMYLAEAGGIPKPASEVKGLILLGKEEIHRLCQGHITLEQFLQAGGKAILRADSIPSFPWNRFSSFVCCPEYWLYHPDPTKQ